MKIKQNMNNWKVIPCSQIGIFDIIILNFPKLINKCKAISIRMPTGEG